MDERIHESLIVFEKRGVHSCNGCILNGESSRRCAYLCANKQIDCAKSKGVFILNEKVGK